MGLDFAYVRLQHGWPLLYMFGNLVLTSGSINSQVIGHVVVTSSVTCTGLELHCVIVYVIGASAPGIDVGQGARSSERALGLD